MTQYIEPYTPNMVPQHDDPDMAELERFLSDELLRIEVAIRGAAVMAAYAGLTVDTPQTGVANIVARRIDEFNGFTPEAPNRITTAAPTFDILTPLEDGVYMAQCQFTAEVNQLTTYRITLAKDDVFSGIFGAWRTSNQVTDLTMTFSGMVEIAPGEEISVYVQADSDLSTFNIQSGIFMLYRISELHRVRS